MNEIKVEAKAITLFIKDPDDWPIAERIAGSMKTETPGVFQYTRSPGNLNKIYTTFTGPKRPALKGGSFFMDRERERLRNYGQWTAQLAAMKEQERVALEPNGKFVPFAHQTKIAKAPEIYPFAAIFSSCGTGKTGSAARAVERAIETGHVIRGKTLVSAPLSILKRSWMDDIEKFTNLKACILWSSEGNKDILGEEEVFICDYGPKPNDASSVKTKSQVLYKNTRTSQILPKLTELERHAAHEWVKYRAKVKHAYNLDGNSTPFGETFGRTTVKSTSKLDNFKAKLADPSYDLFLINHDGVRIYKEVLLEHGFAWVIVDESTKIKNMRSSVTQAHLDISWKCKRRTILTGTPNPNGFEDLWAQFYFLDRGLTLEGSVADFHAEYFFPVQAAGPSRPDQVKWVLKSNADRDRLIARVKRSAIFFRQRDCIDLPPRLDLRREPRMEGEQERAYLEMENDLVTEFIDKRSEKQIRAEAVNILSKMMKLRQITSGFIVGDEGIKGRFKQNPKLSDLEDFVEQLGEEKLVIACQFKEEIHTLLEKYAELGVAAIYGDEPISRRDENIRRFQSTDELKIIVLQPQAAAHGITLTEAHHLLFLSLDFNFEYYYQTAKRIERLGQKSSMFVYHSLATLSDGSPTIDHDLMDVLGLKAKAHDVLFDSGANVGDAAVEISNRLLKRAESRV